MKELGARVHTKRKSPKNIGVVGDSRRQTATEQRIGLERLEWRQKTRVVLVFNLTFQNDVCVRGLGYSSVN